MASDSLYDWHNARVVFAIKLNNNNKLLIYLFNTGNYTFLSSTLSVFKLN